jgi:hypothetical protein
MAIFEKCEEKQPMLQNDELVKLFNKSQGALIRVKGVCYHGNQDTIVQGALSEATLSEKGSIRFIVTGDKKSSEEIKVQVTEFLVDLEKNVLHVIGYNL